MTVCITRQTLIRLYLCETNLQKCMWHIQTKQFKRKTSTCLSYTTQRVQQANLISWAINFRHFREAYIYAKINRSKFTLQKLIAAKINRFTVYYMLNEPRHDKTNKMTVRPAKTQISLCIHPIWSESSLSAWRNHGSISIHWVHSEDSDLTGWIPRLIWVFAGRTLILLAFSCHGSNWL